MSAYKRHFSTQRTYCRNYEHISPIIHWAYQIQTDLDKIQPFQYFYFLFSNQYLQLQFVNCYFTVLMKWNESMQHDVQQPYA